MRRLVIVGTLVAIGLVIARRGAGLHERLMARCEAMFERAPDTFPPKRAIRDIEDIRADTSRILALLEARTNEVVRDAAA